MITHLPDTDLPPRRVTEIGITPALGQVAYNIRALLDRIHAQFITEVRVTLIVRMPGDPNADIIVTADEMLEIAAVIERRKEQAGEIV